ncbi:MAG: NYN domain-containing protein [Anaerolineae bacterium]|nr:NYN domain-containing protein [Anaerolineae bacterium]
MESKPQVAIFMDFENVALSAEDLYGKCDLNLIMNVAEQWGHSVIRRAYCDWTGFAQYQQDLIEYSFELTQLFRYSSRHRKNAADIQMVVDALETAFTHPEVNVFVLVTGDSDFSAVARKLRAYGKQVIGIGLRQSTSEVLVKACDHFVLYDTLIEDTRTSVYRLERARQLLLDVMRMLLPQVEGDAVNGSQLKMMMLKMDPTFNEADMGYPQFRNFLEAQSDLVKIALRDQVLWVSLKPAAMLEPAEDELLQYRLALSTAGLRLLDPHTRTDILLDLYTLFSEAAGVYTLDKAIIQLKVNYDTDNILRSREEVQEVARLVKYADVWLSPPQSWQLDALALRNDVQAQEFVDRSESAYLVVMIQNNLELQSAPLAQLLFGTLDQRARVDHLIDLAQQTYIQSQVLDKTQCAVGAGICYLNEIAELEQVLKELEAVRLEGPLSLEHAAELNREGLRVRMTNFEQAREHFIQAARIVCDLMAAGERGASRMDLEWYLASYCAATAGVHYFRVEYEQAKDYYLAFFALAKETEPVWEKVQRLVEPLLSFYFILAAGAQGELLEFRPGRTHPARMAIALYTDPNETIREQWLALVERLHQVNPAVLRIVIRRLETLEQTSPLPGTRETRLALERIVNP